MKILNNSREISEMRLCIAYDRFPKLPHDTIISLLRVDQTSGATKTTTFFTKVMEQNLVDILSAAVLSYYKTT